jgi:hypothetical protein
MDPDHLQMRSGQPAMEPEQVRMESGRAITTITAEHAEHAEFNRGLDA